MNKNVPNISNSFNVVATLCTKSIDIFKKENFGKKVKKRHNTDVVIFKVGITIFGKGIIVALNDS